MKILFKIFVLILSTLLIQNKAFSYSKNSGKVSVTVSVSKADKSDETSVGVKTEASATKSIENITNSSKDDEKRFFDFTKKTNYDIEITEKKAELVDYVQKTFEVMGLIN